MSGNCTKQHKQIVHKQTTIESFDGKAMQQELMHRWTPIENFGDTDTTIICAKKEQKKHKALYSQTNNKHFNNEE